MKQIQSMKELLVHEIKDIYHAEQQLLKALPKMAKKASSPDLKEAFEHHLKETEEHVSRLEQVFEKLGEKPKTEVCHAMKGLVEEAEDILEQKNDGQILDAALIGAAQKVEHYEIASYGTIVEWAKNLGEKEAANILGKTLEEEEKADELLTKLARKGINKKAVNE
jgi:ferritin-like metal-binding protein YciE